MPDLQVAPCGYDAAAYAVRHWHYSGAMPVGKLVKYGVWEDRQFIGAVMYAWGANRNLGKPFGLDLVECVELVRVAMRDHQAPVSQAVARTLRSLREANPGLRLVVSFADPYEGHHGGIYQAGNWIYLGQTAPKRELEVDGKTINRRAYTGQQFGGGSTSKGSIPRGAIWVDRPGKHRYAYPLDKAMRRRLTRLTLPYPDAP